MVVRTEAGSGLPILHLSFRFPFPLPSPSGAIHLISCATSQPPVFADQPSGQDWDLYPFCLGSGNSAVRCFAVFGGIWMVCFFFVLLPLFVYCHAVRRISSLFSSFSVLRGHFVWFCTATILRFVCRFSFGRDPTHPISHFLIFFGKRGKLHRHLNLEKRKKKTSKQAKKKRKILPKQKPPEAHKLHTHTQTQNAHAHKHTYLT